MNLYIVSSPRLIKQDIYVLLWADDEYEAIRIIMQITENYDISVHPCVLHKFDNAPSNEELCALNFPQSSITASCGLWIRVPIDEIIFKISNIDNKSTCLCSDTLAVVKVFDHKYNQLLAEFHVQMRERLPQEDIDKLTNNLHLYTAQFDEILGEIFIDTCKSRMKSMNIYASKLLNKIIE